MRELDFLIGEKPITYDARGWLRVHDCYEGWAPSEPRSVLSGHAVAIIVGAVMAGVVVFGWGL